MKLKSLVSDELYPRAIGVVVSIILFVFVIFAMILFVKIKEPVKQAKGAESSAPVESIEQSSEPEPVQEVSESEPEEEGPKMILGGVQDSYFDDALFIGDSRTVGLYQSGALKNATYFGKVGASNDDIVYSKAHVDGFRTVSLSSLLEEEDFGKVYIMLGINGLYAYPEDCFESFKTVLDMVQRKQNGAVIYVVGNIGATKAHASQVWYTEKEIVDEYNELLKTLDNGKNIVYLNPSEAINDEEGYLDTENAQDGLHLNLIGNVKLSFYFRTHAFVEEGTEIRRDDFELNTLYHKLLDAGAGGYTESSVEESAEESSEEWEEPEEEEESYEEESYFEESSEKSLEETESSAETGEGEEESSSETESSESGNESGEESSEESSSESGESSGNSEGGEGSGSESSKSSESSESSESSGGEGSGETSGSGESSGEGGESSQGTESHQPEEESGESSGGESGGNTEEGSEGTESGAGKMLNKNQTILMETLRRI